MGTSRRAVVYLRISLDATGEGLAVSRQRDACTAIVAERGWTSVGEFVDNSISASDARKNRPGYDALVKAFEAGEFDALVCYDLDRLTRQPRQLEDWIDAAEGRGLALVTANGEADLTTDGGRLFARIKLAVGRGEVERKSARQKAAAHQRSTLGRPPLGVRLTGYTAKGETVAKEADLVRRIFATFHAGESLRGITRVLTDEGVVTRSGRPWNPSSIRSILANPRYCGRAVYQGQPTGRMGNWEPLVGEDTFDIIQARLRDPRRVSNREGTDRKHLGSGLYLCGVCDEPTSSWSQGRYRCREGHVNRAQDPVDRWVRLVIAARLRREDLADLLAPTEAKLEPLVAEAERLRKRLAKIESDYDNDLIDGRRYAAATAQVRAERQTVERQLASHGTNSAVAELFKSPDPAQAFLDSGLMAQRAVVDSLAIILLHKGIRHSREFNPETVTITPRTAQK